MKPDRSLPRALLFWIALFVAVHWLLPSFTTTYVVIAIVVVAFVLALGQVEHGVADLRRRLEQLEQHRRLPAREPDHVTPSAFERLEQRVDRLEHPW